MSVSFLKTFAFILLAASLHSFSSSALASTFEFKTHSTHPIYLALIKNCLDYGERSGYQTKLEVLQTGVTLAAYENFKTPLHAQAFAQRCLNTFFETETFFDRFQNTTFLLSELKTQNRVRLFSVPALTEPLWLLNYFPAQKLELPKPVIPTELSKQELSSLSATIQLALKQKNYQAAIDLVVQGFKFNLHEYNISPKLDQSHEKFCITQHNTQAITVGKKFFANSCILALAIRHELEHVEQWKRSNTARSQGWTHNFGEHIERERIAYLNDYAFADQYCNDANLVSELRANALDQLKNKYIHRH